jgi:hypothetical protein
MRNEDSLAGVGHPRSPNTSTASHLTARSGVHRYTTQTVAIVGKKEGAQRGNIACITMK